jgi:hypothetical protein
MVPLFKFEMTDTDVSYLPTLSIPLLAGHAFTRQGSAHPLPLVAGDHGLPKMENLRPLLLCPRGSQPAASASSGCRNTRRTIPHMVEHETRCLVLAAGNGGLPEIRKLDSRQLLFTADSGGFLKVSKYALHRLVVLVRSGSTICADGECNSA